ncbi:hypothetical protein [Nocardia abscessus]|uniref:hypothetical protein n=1 Tax=Nocardia abscessus TaxID=120957 RepID=UPI00245691B7|nr:hypothetical protein [Nocardia abscessus]
MVIPAAAAIEIDRVVMRGGQFVFAACRTAARVFVREQQHRRYFDTVWVAPGGAAGLRSMANERLFLEPWQIGSAIWSARNGWNSTFAARFGPILHADLAQPANQIDRKRLAGTLVEAVSGLELDPMQAALRLQQA